MATSLQEVALSMDQYINVAGCSCPKSTIINLQDEVKALVS